jgi:nitrite reductase (NADH) small subunit
MPLRDVTDMTILCAESDLMPNAGVCSLYDEEQIAVFYLPNRNPQLYAIQNWDPIGKANVLSRGIVGELNSQLVVSSPLYKQHFNLQSGTCLEDENASVKTYPVSLVDGNVVI